MEFNSAREVIDELSRINGNCSHSEVARRIELKGRQNLSVWFRYGYIPSHYALNVEKASKGLITIRQILELEQKVRSQKQLSKESE